MPETKRGKKPAAKTKPAAKAKPAAKTSRAKTTVSVTATKYKLPYAPWNPAAGTIALSADGRYFALGRRRPDEGGPTLAVFDLQAKRKGKTLSLSDPDTIVVETEALFVGHVSFLDDGRLAYSRSGDVDELVVCRPGGEASAFALKDQSVAATGGSHGIVLYCKNYNVSKARTEVVEFPVPGEKFGKVTVARSEYPLQCAYGGGRFWLEYSKEWLGFSPRGESSSKLKFETDSSATRRYLAASERFLAYAQDYRLQVVDLDSHEVTKLAAPDYKEALAIHGSRVMIADTNGHLRLYDAESGRELWNHKASGPRRAPGAITFSADGSTAVATLSDEPGECVVMRFA